MPEIVDGIKIAKLFDGTRDGAPYVVDRPALPIGPERADFLAYLKKGKIVMRAAGQSVDRLDESRGKTVPIVFLTDGEWVWSASIGYYLEEHGLPPEPEFLDYLRARDFHYVTPTEDKVRTAGRAVRGE
ncbi:hypothetical protein [Frankia sp. AgB32]|uniref:hypothetical protein n=1 Tax=Frankia sp. AgB32 TaxID=631119 RepID=UPI00200EAE5E|nr:hypothetical protein [Frankia sp. AgB32]MCK9893891.1 hypothetical protein [Frankia sp. AgB32]